MPFNLATGPLLRTKLLRLTDSDYLLLITMHHIISDHWSMRIFRSELQALYDAFSQGRSSPLPDPLIQFADFAYWERRLLEEGLLNAQVDYWKKRLSRSMREIKFTRDGGSKKRLSFRTSRQSIELEQDLFAAVKTLARKENGTPFIILLTVLTLMLYHYAGQPEIRIGILVANRARKETEGVIGHFTNTLVLCTHVDPDMTLRTLLREVRKIFLSAYAHQELPFEQLARLLKESRDESKSLFQVLFNYQNPSPQPSAPSGLTFAPWDGPYEHTGAELTPTTFDLIFTVRETSTTLTGSVNYKTQSRDKEAVRRMFGLFRSLLRKATAAPDQRIADIPVD
jgi:NRPS condensation-like uncharacterized protein